MLKTVLFDLGNTLVDYHAGPSSDEERDFRGLAKMSERLRSWGFEVTPDRLSREFYEPWIALFARRKQARREFDVLALLEPVLPRLKQEQLRSLLLDFHEPTVQEAVTDSGTPECLAALKRTGLKLGLVSNSPLPGYCHDETLRRLGILRFLDFRLYSYDECVRKPDPEILLRALRAAGSTSGNTVLVGDSIELDLQPATEMGMRVIHYLSSKKRSPDFSTELCMGRVWSIPEIEPLLKRP